MSSCGLVLICNLNLGPQSMHVVPLQQTHVWPLLWRVYPGANAVTSLNLNQQRAVKITAVACGLAYVSTIVVILTHCRPISNLWRVYPYPGGKLWMSIQEKHNDTKQNN